jgi:hypothetical protein
MVVIIVVQPLKKGMIGNNDFTYLLANRIQEFSVGEVDFTLLVKYKQLLKDYNTERPHKALGYPSPLKYAEQRSRPEKIV